MNYYELVIVVKSTTYLLPVKHPFVERAFVFSTGSMDLREHDEKRSLFALSPDVARANIM